MNGIPDPIKKAQTKEEFFFNGKKQKPDSAKSKNVQSLKKNLKKADNETESKQGTISLKQAKFDVYNFGIKGLSKEEQDNAKMQLAIKLGAKPLKRNCINYKELIKNKNEEKKINKELSEQHRTFDAKVLLTKKDLFNKKRTNLNSQRKAKINRGHDMNNFDGQLELYPEICIDNFSSNVLFNPRIRCFILTHFHDDHMKNLEDFNFYRILRENSLKVKFFCSAVTKDFIETCDKYSHLAGCCNVVSPDTPFIVNISDKITVTVTFSGSGHCPGSVMAFIEGPRGNVLFTGDFRLPSKSTSKLPIFNQTMDESNTKQLKNVDNLYIDMTFFKPSYPRLPNRDESVQVLLQFLDDFLEKDKKNDFENLVYLKTSARIGYEFVFQEINRYTGFKIHVNNLIFRLYEKIPSIQNLFTVDPYATPIHCCIYDNSRKKCENGNSLFKFESKCDSKKSESSKKTLIPCILDENKMDASKLSPGINAVKIILSAMYFTDNPGINKIFIEFKPNKNDRHYSNYLYYKKIYRLCYSFHSSMEEIVNFVNTLRPNKIHSIALPESTSENLIRKYFYDNNNKFVEFHLSNGRKRVFSEKESEKKIYHKKEILDDLMVKKRNLLNNCQTKLFEHYSSSEESDGSENEYLKFNDSEQKLIRKKSRTFS
ncbi:artemis [Brachionus plicatilis]|uniref:Protein artemis n=1 Tax=Brachionus plicatilis TaxID=10195 RepID=A0A3M7SCK5_BRAPC|nr:artemis [Brachionus plicatilis]